MKPLFHFQKFSRVLFTAATMLMALSSCIREELHPCPPLQIQLEVEDKNYNNIYAVSRLGLEELRREDLPFREYVSTLYYQLTEVATGKVVAKKSLHTVEGDAQTLRLSLPEDLPFGKYVLTAWGNVSDTRMLEHPEGMNLHPDGKPGDDTYLANDTLVYNERAYSYLLKMKRVKGKLIVVVKDMPSGFGYSEKSVDDISSYVNHEFHYSGSLLMKTATVWDNPDSVRTEMLLGPSVHPTSSVFNIRFYQGSDASSNNGIAPEAVTISMIPNNVTVLKYIYDPCCERFTIYMLINDSWEQLHSMDIN